MNNTRSFENPTFWSVVMRSIWKTHMKKLIETRIYRNSHKIRPQWSSNKNIQQGGIQKRANWNSSLKISKSWQRLANLNSYYVNTIWQKEIHLPYDIQQPTLSEWNYINLYGIVDLSNTLLNSFCHFYLANSSCYQRIAECEVIVEILDTERM